MREQLRELEQATQQTRERAAPELANMRILQKGNRLSITPVDPAEWKFIVDKLMK